MGAGARRATKPGRRAGQHRSQRRRCRRPRGDDGAAGVDGRTYEQHGEAECVEQGGPHRGEQEDYHQGEAAERQELLAVAAGRQAGRGGCGGLEAAGSMHTERW